MIDTLIPHSRNRHVHQDAMAGKTPGTEMTRITFEENVSGLMLLPLQH